MSFEDDAKVIVEVLLLSVSVILLYFGADFLVSGSSKLGLKVGLSPLVIGLTIVAFGTSFPELLVSVQSALQGHDGIALGNVVGSNIFNIGIILGLSACIYPQRVHSKLILRDVPFMVVTAILICLFMLDGQVARTEGFVLTSGIFLFTWINIKQGKTEAETSSPSAQAERWAGILARIFGGLFLLALGSSLLVNSASSIASTMGISDAIIGLTIVAAGTSMPELATSIVAALKKQSDIAIGNIVGSNIFNALCILGISSVIHPLSAAGITQLDLVIMLGLSILLWPILWTRHLLQRWEGGVLLLVYGLYLWAIWP